MAIPNLRHLWQKPTLRKDYRTSFLNSDVKDIRRKFLKQTTIPGVLFCLWFVMTCSYVYGTLFQSGGRRHNFRILGVDYDGGVIGHSVEVAYQQLKGPGFFNVEFHTPEEYPSEEDMFQAVRRGDFWGAISATAGASDRLAAAIQGGEAASTYNPATALGYIWNEQKYPAFANSVVKVGMQTLIGATRIAYNHINGTQASKILNQQDPAAIQVFLNPIAAQERNVKVASFGNSVLLNTIGTIIPVLSQFFFLLVLNGAMRQHQMYSRLTVRSSLILRRVVGLAYAFASALCQAGFSWEFRENWDVNGVQFVLTWMTFWLLMEAHQLMLDTILTVAPMPAMPFTVLLFIFLNVASTLSPLELQAGFYKWSMALPGHNAYLVLVTIWTGGADNKLYRALPILFAWVVLGLITTTLGHWRACHLAFKMEKGDLSNADLAKDVELGESADRLAMSRKTTIDREADAMQRRRSAESVALEQRQIYGPSIPPFGSA
jgi:hypothetical protein